MWKKICGKLCAIQAKRKNKKFEATLQKNLRNDNFSIICSNCIGGIIYHRLKKEFLSPTINLWMDQKDFLRFVLNLEEYIGYTLTFDEKQTNYPIGRLKDILIHFNHYKTMEEAKDAWERRKKRINLDNLYIIMYDTDGIKKEDILKLDNVKCKNKIVFSLQEYSDIPYVQKVENIKTIQEFMNVDTFGIRVFEKQFNFVNFLNAKQ